MTKSGSLLAETSEPRVSVGGEVRYARNRVVIKLKSEHQGNYDAQQKLLGRLPQDSQIETGFDELGIAVITLPAGADVLAIAKDVEQSDLVEFAEPDFLDSGQ